jgi:hypothetical protein
MIKNNMIISLQSFSCRGGGGGRGRERERGNLPISSSRDGFAIVVAVPSAFCGVVGITRKPPRTDRLPSLQSSGTECERGIGRRAPPFYAVRNYV